MTGSEKIASPATIKAINVNARRTRHYSLKRIQRFEAGGAYHERTRPAGSFFQIVKRFYASGHVQMKGLMIAEGESRVGVWYHFAEDGSLSETVDHDQGLDLSLDEFVLCLRDQGIPVTEGWTRHPTRIRSASEPPSWWVTYELNPSRLQSVQIDAATGRVIDHNQSGFEECGTE